ncbi:MAG: HAD family hydrolase [FCB group bacterium]|nr:HAD family hydrolase [FCB group bacterium]
MPAYKHIIWDWNGTLFNDSWLCLKSMNLVLSRRDMPALTQDRYEQIFEFPVINYYRKLGFDFDSEPFEISGMEFIHEYNSRHHLPELQPEALSILKKIHSSEITQSLLSAQEQNTLDDLIKRFEIGHLFQRVIGLDNHYAYSKIDSGKAWMNELNLDSHEVLFIGDTDHDKEVADAIGADCILIPAGHQTREKLEATGAPVISSLKEIPGYMGINSPD